jgi:hypothetical protein
MSTPVIILLLGLLVAVWVLIRIRRQSVVDQAAPKRPTSAANSAYHAVSIKLTPSACKAARDMAGRRFLSTAAPKLPLPDCDVLDCNCRFVHHKDRRSGKDRRSPFGPSGFGSGTGNYETEQRKGQDRRQRNDDDYL